MEKINEYISQINHVNAKIINLYEQWVKQKGIQYSHFLVLYALIEEEKMTQKQIGERCHLIKQTVNAIVKSLQAEEYITLEKSENNKKEKWISLTDKGNAYAHSIIDDLFLIEESVSKRVGKQQLETMIEINHQFKDILEDEMKKDLGK